jgi:hypothetical protein
MKLHIAPHALELQIRETANGARPPVRRTVCVQWDGEIIFAEACLCHRDPLECPIDKHAIQARKKELEK